MLPEIELRKNGFLYTTKYSKKPLEDVTDGLLSFLLYECILEPGITLKDIFLLAKKHKLTLGAILGNWFEEILEEGLATQNCESSVEQTSYLVVEWELMHELSYFSGLLFPSVYQMVDKEHYLISQSNCSKLINLPVILSNAGTLQYYSFDCNKNYDLKDLPFTLLNIFQSIFWTLTECGSPEMRDKFNLELEKRIADLENGTAKTFSWEEVKAKLEETKLDKKEKDHQINDGPDLK